MILNGLTKNINISAMNIRIGNTFKIKFAITKAGEPYDLNDKDLILIMTNKVKRSEIVVEEYTIIGDNNNVLYWTFEGKDQIDRCFVEPCEMRYPPRDNPPKTIKRNPKAKK